MQDCKVSILGTEYMIFNRDEKDDPLLDGQSRDGYTDISMHQIVLCNKKDDCEFRDYENYKKSVLRHEIIHAFLYESGLDASSSFSGAWAVNEEMCDWIAIQFPKIAKVFQELDIL